jgi:hypothetical protein
MASLADFDDSILALIIHHLPLFDRVSLRATCRRTRAIIPAPRKRTPQKQWRRAMRHGDLDIARESIEAGARDLLRYAGEASTIDECRAAWIARFADDMSIRRAILGARAFGDDEHVLQLTDAIRAIYRGDGSLAMSYVRENALTDHIAPFAYCDICKLIGKYLSDDYIHEIARELEKIPDKFRILSAISGIIFGALKRGRIPLALHYARVLNAMEDVNDNYRATQLAQAFIQSGNVQACRELPPALSSDRGSHLEYAAISGNREMCAYIRELLGDPFDFGRMVMGAAKSGNIEMIDLALEWADKCESIDTISFEIYDNRSFDTFAFCADGILDVLKHTTFIASQNSVSSVFLKAIIARFRARAKLARDLNYERALVMLRQPTRVSCQCVSRLKKYDDESRDDDTMSVPYEGIFDNIGATGAYWLIDMICEMADKDGCMRKITLTHMYDYQTGPIVALPLRGHYTRKIRARMQKRTE